jgi:predicted nuclease of predicted toxin-antitoxin system
VKVIANENVAGLTVEALRARGFDVAWARVEMPGAADEDILRRAQAEDRLVLTHDRDFGELAFRWGLPATSGVVLLRLSMQDPAAAAQRISSALASRVDWHGCFAVVEDERIRVVPLPVRPRAGGH